MIRNKLATLFLVAALASTSFTVSASEVNTTLAANPTAMLSAIDSIGTPLSDQAAGEVRGEGWITSFLISAASNMGIKGVEIALGSSATPAQLRAAYPGVYGWVLSFFPWAVSPQIVY